MSAPRVKVTVDHLRTQITEYLETQAIEEADAITTAVRDAVDAFDFDAETRRICEQELRKFVADAAGVYFRTLLKSQDAHTVIREALRNQLEDK